MSIYKTIIDHIDRLSIYKKPIRASFYDTYCTIYILSKEPGIIHIDYKPIARAYSNIASSIICQLCSVEDGKQISCFDCGNSYCVMCFVKMICVNYSLGSYPCPYCKYKNKFLNDKHIITSIMMALLHFNMTQDEITNILVKIIEESPSLLNL